MYETLHDQILHDDVIIHLELLLTSICMISKKAVHFDCSQIFITIILILTMINVDSPYLILFFFNNIHSNNFYD